MSHAKYGSTISEFSRRYRESEGITMRELGERIGYSEQNVWNVENGYGVKLPMTYCQRLMAILDEPRKQHLKEIVLEMTTELALARVMSKMEEKSVRKPKTAAKKPNKR